MASHAPLIASWTQATLLPQDLLDATLTTTPSPRSFHAMAPFPLPGTIRQLVTSSDPDRLHCCLVAGGRDDSTIFNDLWVLVLDLSGPKDSPVSRWYPVSLEQHQLDGIDPTASPYRLLCRAYHTLTYQPRTEIIAEAEDSSSPTCYCGDFWMYGGKESTSPGPQPFVSSMVRLRLWAASTTTTTTTSSSNDKTRSSATFRCRVALMPQSNALHGSRAYHSAVLLQQPTASLMVYGGFTGHEFVDVVSVFDLSSLVWEHYLPRPADHPALTGQQQTPASPTAACETERRTTRCAQKLCSHCGALSSCVHRSRHLRQLCDTKRIFSTAAAASDDDTSLFPRAGTSSCPPRDATVLLRLHHHTDGDSSVYCFGGEVMQTFFNTVIRLTIKPSSSEWTTLSEGTEVSANDSSDVDDDNVAVASSPADARTPLSMDARIRAAAHKFLSPSDADDARAIDAAVLPNYVPAALPEPRAYHTAWAIGSRLFAIWGGFSISRQRPIFFDDLHVFDTRRCCWVPVDRESMKCPSRRASASCASVDLDSAVIFGGDDGARYFNDVWICRVRDAPDQSSTLRLTLRAAAQDFFVRVSSAVRSPD